MNRISKINYAVFSNALVTSVPFDLDLLRSHVSGPALREWNWLSPQEEEGEAVSGGCFNSSQDKWLFC